MPTSTLLFPPGFFEQIEASSTAGAVSLLKDIANAVLPKLIPYLPWAFCILFAVLIFASVKAAFGETGTLGSLLYHLFYFGILGIIVWANGFEIFFNAYFDIITLVLYRFCYWLTGLILQKFKKR